MASRRKAGGYTYFIQAGEGGPIKIGKSTDPDGRLRSLQTSNAQPLRILLVLEGSHQEGRIHRMFAAHRLEGEWFSPSPEILEFIEAMSGADESSEDEHESEPSPKRRGLPSRSWDFSDKSFEETLADLRSLDRALTGFMVGFPSDPEKLANLARSLCRQEPVLVPA